ncbi:putative inactive ATP-dependent zinc metalloprotease FTSHI 5, chloroplastic [Silene latifolia]|uniref:putative inactive ATP-dependent zinc metalloprotease FTSHI 5, chloroplastic n=1 Tax=Silene latifolia TaxID=37657 RepID=UPI003D77246A
MFPTCPSSSNSIVTPFQSIPHYNSTPFSTHHHHGRRKRLKTSTKPKILVEKSYPCHSFFNFRRKSSWACFSNQFAAPQVCESSINSSVNLDNVGLIEEKDRFLRSNSSVRLNKDGLFSGFSKSIAFTLFWIVIGMCPVRGHPPLAVALPSISDLVWRKKGKVVKEEQKLVSWKEHEYSRYTNSLLESVSDVLKVMEAVRAGESKIDDLEAALKGVKLKREELQIEIMGGLFAELRELGKEKWEFDRRANDVLVVVLSAKREQDKLLMKLKGDRQSVGGDKGVREKIDKLVKEMDSSEREYNALQEKAGEVEDEMLRRETMALSIGVRELSFVEQECERLVQRFTQTCRHSMSSSKKSTAAFSKNDIQHELEAAQREHVKQMVLPGVVESDDALQPLFEGEQTDFASHVKQTLQESKNLQREVEARIRREMKKHGDEKRIVVNTPEGEVVKGFPEVDLKWMFGDKEVVVPKAVSVHLHHGWKRWRKDAKAKLKKSLLESVDRGEQYVAERLERIVLDRDRVVSKTLYNEEKNRWEMDPIAVPYAVSKNLVEYARIRHDWGAMYIGLKGEDKDFFVNIKEYEVLFEDFGGFDGLYLKMIASGVPTAVHLMWIPLSELSIYQQVLLLARLSYQLINGIWKTRIVSFGQKWLFTKIKNINDDIMMMIVFPIVEFLIPYPIRIKLGMAWPEEIGVTIDSTWYLKWQSEAETNFKLRKRDNLGWYFWFLIRSALYGYVLFHVFKYLKRKVPRLLGYGPYRRNPNFRKLQRVLGYIKFRKQKIIMKKRAGVDPIKTAFDDMKRVKNPPIRLKDFASVDSMREEINEVVAFLQNPSAFQKLGARAPRGVLIVGERGTGKTSLALAIAAEAKVPVVNIEAQQLEAGLWVGQSASNVRELFQTARDLAPVIIFVEDFDLFAGVRGKFIHTKQQDHEAFINQLLVELDGFEKQDGVVLMATTRNLNQIDEALRRPGRMDRMFNLQRPTEAERESILRKAAREAMDPDIIDFVDWRKVAEKTALLRPIELKLVPVALEGSAFRSKFLDTEELMSYCSWFSTFSASIPSWLRKTKVARQLSRVIVNHLGLTLTKEDLKNVVDLMEPYGQISNGIELYTPPVEWTRETKFPHAVWAAGRGLIALLLPNFDVVDTMWLEPLAWEGIGCTKITQAKSGGSMYGNVETISYLEKKLVFCFGSHVASQLLLPFGEENLLSTSELKQAQEIATRMVLQYGWGPDETPAIYHHGYAATTLSMGSKHEYEMAAKVEQIYNLAFDKAIDMLKKNQQVLRMIVDELLEYEILTGKDLERIMESNGGIREKEPFSLSSVYVSESISVRYLDNGTASGTPLLGGAN